MKSKEALNKLKHHIDGTKLKDKEILDCYITITKDLEMLEFIKTHYEMNGFNELIPRYLDDGDEEKFVKLEKWLEK